MYSLVKLGIDFLLFSGLIIGSSCSSNNKKQAKVSQEIESQVLFENFMEVQTSDVNYKIPSPIELFFFLERSNLPFVDDALHKPEKRKEYNTNYYKALNFGIYAADLAYCVVFVDQQTTIMYFDAVKNIAADLGMYEGFGAEMAIRVDDNLSDVDSLINITSESYYLATQFLEDQGMSDLLGLILVGGWVEGLYITVESIGNSGVDNPVIERVADQQILLDNLIAFLKTNKDSENIAKVLLSLEDLQEAFDELYFNDEQTIITKKQYVNIVNKVREIRTEIID